VLLLLLGIATSASATDIAGTWRVTYVGGFAWKPIGGAEFEFKVKGKRLEGMAHVGRGWPGTAPISDGTIDGDHISFLVFGQAPSSDGYPKMRFSGTFQGDEIRLTMTLFYSGEETANHGETDFKGSRIRNSK